MLLKPDDLVKTHNDNEIYKVAFINHEDRTFLSPIIDGHDSYQVMEFSDVDKVYREIKISTPNFYSKV